MKRIKSNALIFVSTKTSLALINVIKNNTGINNPITNCIMTTLPDNNVDNEISIDNMKINIPATRDHLSFLATPAAKEKYIRADPKNAIAIYTIEKLKIANTQARTPIILKSLGKCDVDIIIKIY